MFSARQYADSAARHNVILYLIKQPQSKTDRRGKPKFSNVKVKQ
jgi:hypothetical protein